MKSFFVRFGVVGLLGLVAYLGIIALRPSGHARFLGAHARANAECRAYRSAPGHANADVCRDDDFGPSATKAFRDASAKLDEARAAFDRGDVAAGRTGLIFGMAEGREIERRGTIIGQLMGAKVVARVLDMMDAHRAELDVSARMSILANGLHDKTKPFETYRIHSSWRLAQLRDVASESTLADEMSNDDAAFREMQRAILENDVPRCERASAKLGPLMGPHATLCAKLHSVQDVRQRLEARMGETIRESLPPRAP